MLRRQLIASALAAPALWARQRVDYSRLSLLTDEVGKTPADSIAFCRQYGVRSVELRSIPGQGSATYAFLDEPQLRNAARELKEAGLRVTFLNTPLLKFAYPGSELARRRTETPEQKLRREDREKQQFDQRLEYLGKAIRAAHIFGVRQVRVFTFSRVTDPVAFLPSIVPVMAEMIQIADRAGIRLLVENEGSCNVATSQELAAICRLLPQRAFGINWDPVNALSYKEQTWPDGYRALPIHRVHNVQMKARGLVIGPDFVDWKSIFDALGRDGYKGHVGLETHVFDGTLIEKAHLCMKKLQEMMHA